MRGLDDENVLLSLFLSHGDGIISATIFIGGPPVIGIRALLFRLNSYGSGYLWIRLDLLVDFVIASKRYMDVIQSNFLLEGFPITISVCTMI
ncbi:hypothetical protein H5410_011133 [Solanum commersonii]|uniref:Transmembrane protein n=1 Tax=Solanum commersonii TaxID=4109 RepID=A0A9J6ANS5_SOLCO|nr:hypothetical protein H5410_011133 [Solanum commersonii]